ncbi:MAG: tRNA dihydrouridine(20/20a) synthase DusA [Pseudomonadota bacterium]
MCTALQPSTTFARRFCVAPMMEWTDRHCRFFHRQLTRHAMLYTEMVTVDAVLYGPRARLLDFDAREQPLALQLGGCDPAKLAEAAAIGEAWGYDEINLNVGCPSDRVQNGRFGACLMAEPETVAACVAAMRARVAIPVTVKCRIGIDEQDSERDLTRFVDGVANAGCSLFIVHARKAWLQGLSPKQNRDVPPLDYARVHRLRAARPDLGIVINGGLADHAAALAQLEHVDGVMLGRAAYQRPALLASVDRLYYGADAGVHEGADAGSHVDIDEHAAVTAAVEAMVPYINAHLAAGGRLNQITRHMLGAFHGRPGARGYRRHLAQHAHLPGADAQVLTDALDHLKDPSGETSGDAGHAQSLNRADADERPRRATPVLSA